MSASYLWATKIVLTERPRGFVLPHFKSFLKQHLEIFPAFLIPFSSHSQWVSPDLCLSYTTGKSVPRQNLTSCIHCIFLDDLEGTHPSPKAAQCHCSHANTSEVSCRSVPSDSTTPDMFSPAYHLWQHSKIHSFGPMDGQHALDEEQNRASAPGILRTQPNKTMIKIRKSSHKLLLSVLSRKPNAVAAAINPCPALPVRNGLVQLTLH